MRDRTKALVVITAILGIFLLLNALYDRLAGPADKLADVIPAAGQEDVMIDIDQTFSLTSQEGEPVGLDSYEGYRLLFFGFTHCPDICPAGLQKISRTLELLGDDKAEAVTPLFVTVDPDRDRPEVMKEYTALFDSRIIGLTGTREEIQEVVGAFKAYAAKSQVEGHNHGHGHDEPYMVDHSAYIYLLNPANDVIDIFGSDESAAEMAEKLEAVLG